jgi:hypothetical protein
MASARRRPGRGTLFAALVVVCLLVGGGIVAWVATQGDPASGSRAADPAVARAAARVAAGPHVVFMDLDRSHAGRYGSLALAPLGQEDERVDVGPVCQRVYAAGGRGICVVKGGGFGAAYGARLLDASLRPGAGIPLNGVPSRARVSADGRYGAVTTFVTGHSYASNGTFSTQTLLIDMRKGSVIGDLERFTFTRDGKRVDAPDINLWGVTFATPSTRFYATLATGGHHYLIAGDMLTRTAHTIHENVECPSLSPDGTRIAYKKRVPVPGGPKGTWMWRLHVLTLKTGADVALAEPRAIDDQAEWLDANHVLYDVGEEVWVVRADGRGTARRYLAAAESPAVVRPSPR